MSDGTDLPELMAEIDIKLRIARGEGIKEGRSDVYREVLQLFEGVSFWPDQDTPWMSADRARRILAFIGKAAHDRDMRLRLKEKK